MVAGASSLLHDGMVQQIQPATSKAACAAVHLTVLSVYMALKMSRAKARFAEQVFKLYQVLLMCINDCFRSLNIRFYSFVFVYIA